MTDTDRTMEPDFSGLASFLDRQGADGYLLDAASDTPDQRYLSGFDAPDPFVSLFVRDRTTENVDGGDATARDAGDADGGAEGSIHLLVSSLEYGRAREESRAASVSRLADYDYGEKRAEHGPERGRYRVLAEFLADHDVSSVAVPPRFPLGTADGLRERDVTVAPEYDGVVAELRAVKTSAEIEHVRTAQRANERAMRAAEALLEEATIAEDGLLEHGDAPLTAERVKREIEGTLLEADHALDETIVSCGSDAADPHDRGSGPLRANEPIIVDVFPRGKASNYHADMTRTFCVGEPTPEISRRYEITLEALEAGLDAISAGTTGKSVHDAVCDVYEEAGYATLRSDERTETGFIHSTGHGVGLAVHELPRLSPSGTELAPGNVVTVEPGLYDPDVGGVRIEDLVVVTEEGYENLTEYPKSLVVD